MYNEGFNNNRRTMAAYKHWYANGHAGDMPVTYQQLYECTLLTATELVATVEYQLHLQATALEQHLKKAETLRNEQAALTTTLATLRCQPDVPIPVLLLG